MPVASAFTQLASVPATRKRSQGCILVATLTIHVSEDADDAAVLAITRFAYERCASAMGLKSAAERTTSEWEQGGELTVAVKRGWDSKDEHANGCDHAGHGHEAEKGKDAHHDHDHHHHHHQTHAHETHDKHAHHD